MSSVKAEDHALTVFVTLLQQAIRPTEEEKAELRTHGMFTGPVVMR